MIDSLLTIPAEIHWDLEIVSISFNVITIGIGFYIAIILNKKMGIATRQKEMLYKHIDCFSQLLDDIGRDIRNGTIVFEKAISTPYSIQTKLYALKKIVHKAYGEKTKCFDSSVTKLINLIYSLIELMDESDPDDKKRYTYNTDQIFAIDRMLSDCVNTILEMQIDINKM